MSSIDLVFIKEWLFNYKGFRPSILVMSATPIPRTLTLAAYGDMDESRLIEKPHWKKTYKNILC